MSFEIIWRQHCNSEVVLWPAVHFYNNNFRNFQYTCQTGKQVYGKGITNYETKTKKVKATVYIQRVTKHMKKILSISLSESAREIIKYGT